MASKLIAQLIVMGTQIVGRAFMDAYRQAAANAGKAGAARASQAASGATSGGSTAINEFTRKTGLSLEESLNILNVDKNVALEELERVRDILSVHNDSSTAYVEISAFNEGQ